MEKEGGESREGGREGEAEPEIPERGFREEGEERKRVLSSSLTFCSSAPPPPPPPRFSLGALSRQGDEEERREGSFDAAGSVLGPGFAHTAQFVTPGVSFPNKGLWRICAASCVC